MAKKISFDNLPSTVEKILEILKAGGSEHQALPELVQRVKRLEMQCDSIERILSPERRTMDKQTVFKVLKLRPKQVNELERAGLLLSHSEGRRTYYYEDDVVKCFMNQSLWKNALEAAAGSEPAEYSGTETPAAEAVAAERPSDGAHLTGRVDIKDASVILDRKTSAIYQLISTKVVPCHKDGRKVYFIAEELREWLKTHPPRKRKNS